MVKQQGVKTLLISCQHDSISITISDSIICIIILILLNQLNTESSII